MTRCSQIQVTSKYHRSIEHPTNAKEPLRNGERTGDERGATPGGRVPGAYRSTVVRRPPITAPETTASCGAWDLRWGPATSEEEGSWSSGQLASKRRKRPSERFHGPRARDGQGKWPGETTYVVKRLRGGELNFQVPCFPPSCLSYLAELNPLPHSTKEADLPQL